MLVAACCAQTARQVSIQGTVRDPSDAAIVSAHVVLLDSAQHEIARADSDASGAFHFDNLASGGYELEIQHEGFRTVRQAVAVGSRSQRLQIILPIAVTKEVVNVQPEARNQVATEDAANQNANTIDRDALDRVPVFDQDYVTTLSRFLDDSEIGTNGVSLVVNGIEANGPGVTPSAVKEVKINQDPYSVLFARPGRARIEITTKPGTPQFHGTANFMARDSVFDATNAYANSKTGENRQYYEGSLTGPLSAKHKDTFLLSFQGDRDDQQAVVVALTPSGTVNESVPLPRRHYFLSGRVFHDLNKSDQIWAGYSFEHATYGNQNVGGMNLPETAANRLFFEHEVNVGYTRVISPRVLNQLRFLVGHFDSPTTSVNSAPSIIVSGAFTGGGAQSDSRRTEYHFDGSDIVSYFRGRQELKFGIDVPDISRRGMDDFTNMAGTYTFASLAAYEQGMPATLLLQRGQGHVVFLERTVAGFISDNIRVRTNLSVTVGVRYYFQNYFHDDTHNFAPRLAFAYAPAQKGKTVIRGGAGVFYDRTGPRPIADLLHFDGVHLLRFIVNNPSYPATPAQIAAVPTSVVVLDPGERMPYTLQYSLGVERQVTPKSTLALTYIGSRGIDMFRSIDANGPPPPLYAARPNPALGQERMIQSEGYQKSNGLEVTFRGKPSRFFSGQVQYTFARTGNNTSGITFFPGNSYDPNADWSRADMDRRHKLDLLASAEPVKNYSVGVALSAYSGWPVNVTTGNDDNHDGIVNDRPAGTPRNGLPGPAFLNLDLNAAHDFHFAKARKEPYTLTVALNAFNVLNHKNDVTYVGVITSPFFGRGVQAQPPRRLQLDVEFKF